VSHTGEECDMILLKLHPRATTIAETATR